MGIVTGLAAEARIAAPLGATACGAPEAAAEALVAQGATFLLSFGLAGGLDPALTPGTILVPRRVLSRGENFPTASMPGAAIDQSLLEVAAVVATREEKARLFAETGAAACDMESGAVARVARRHGIPFAALRAVCDPASRTLPPAALVALDRRGGIGIARVLASLARDPAQLPALLGLARDAARARGALVRRVREIRLRGGLVP